MKMTIGNKSFNLGKEENNPLKKIQATLMKKNKGKELLTRLWARWKAIPALRFFHPVLLAIIALVWLTLAIGVRITKSTYSMVKEGEFGPLPSYEELENPEVIRASEIYSRNNVSLGKYYSENRSDVTFSRTFSTPCSCLVSHRRCTVY